MKLTINIFAVFAASLFTVLLITPITSISNLLWLSSVNMPVTLWSAFEVILFDFQRLGMPLFVVFTIAFILAFSVAGLISKYTTYGGKYLYALAGAVAIGFALILMVELLFQTQLLGGNRSLIGKILHWIAGFCGGYFFHNLFSVDRSYTFIVRFFGIFYAYLLLGFVLNWIFTPTLAAAEFGFILDQLSDDAQKRTFKRFYFLFCSYLFILNPWCNHFKSNLVFFSWCYLLRSCNI